jgi:hypothetical protein
MHVQREARREELQSIHLDSGHHRYEAHRLYLNFGFNITSFHFALDLKNAVELQSIQVDENVDAQVPTESENSNAA